MWVPKDVFWWWIKVEKTKSYSYVTHILRWAQQKTKTKTKTKNTQKKTIIFGIVQNGVQLIDRRIDYVNPKGGYRHAAIYDLEMRSGTIEMVLTYGSRIIAIACKSLQEKIMAR